MVLSKGQKEKRRVNLISIESADSKSKGEQKKRQMLIIHKKKKRNVKNL